MIIYCAINNDNEKIYVGKTIQSLNARISGHYYLRKAESRRAYFGNALRAHGLSSFTWIILEECDDEKELGDLEKKHIINLDSIRPNGYNLRTGGEGGSLCEESKQKIRESLIRWHKENTHPNNGRKATKECLVRMSQVAKSWHQKNPNPMQGKHHSEEARRKMSIAKATMSEETKQKMRLAWKSRAPVSKETRRRQSNSQAGRKHTEETRKKMGVVQKKAWKKRRLEIYYKHGFEN